MTDGPLPVPALIHATCVAIGDTGVLLRGASGSGKSDLALRLIDRGAELVSDDYCHVSAIEGRLYVTPPDRIAGRIEVRGVGILALPYRPFAIAGLVVDLGEEPRLPDPAETVIAGMTVPLVSITPFPASAPIKIERLVACLKDNA
ncbi:HPr kinase/phosphatase C-terminal domain-containing protein [Sphingomonadaceae bacterium jetA1]|jgi:hypothetical protein|uniref:HPr kinase/phosphorylase n=1 Tax=Facivitalis istanbulensis TaxID=3075838 RepID=UPI003493197D